MMRDYGAIGEEQNTSIKYGEIPCMSVFLFSFSSAGNLGRHLLLPFTGSLQLNVSCNSGHHLQSFSLEISIASCNAGLSKFLGYSARVIRSKDVS